ncbi:MAG: PQQ-binding-like beta-propeller repeat protein, partial [Pseudomonadota bacterium]
MAPDTEHSSGPSRRNVLAQLGAAASGLALTSPTMALAKPERPQRAPPAIQLPDWAHGESSVSDATVLMFRGNGAHTFYGTGPLPDKAPEIAWRFKTAGMRRRSRRGYKYWSGMGWTGSAVKLGDYVFVGSVGGYVYALEAMTGRLMWKYRGAGMFKSSVCMFDNHLYIGNTDNYLHCIDAQTGRRAWRFNSRQDIDSSPCVIDGRLYVAGESGYARCLDPKTGREIWKTLVGGLRGHHHASHKGSESSPAVADGEFYTATYAGELVSLETKTGKVRWRAKTYDDTDSSPVVSGDFVYAAAEERAPNLYCFARETGKEIWRYKAKARGYYSTPAVVGDRIWIGAEDGKLHCVDATNGRPIWTFQTRSNIWSSPCVIEDKVIIGSRDYRVYCLDAESGAEVWNVRLDGRILGTPCIVDGRIWVGTATGYFYCL